MLAIGSDWAVLCASIIPDEAERQHVLDRPAPLEAELVTIIPQSKSMVLRAMCSKFEMPKKPP